MRKVIEVEGLSKAYRLGQINTGTLSQDLARRWALVRGKEDPFLKIGETNDRSVKGESNIVWSLKDINFSIEAGSAVGIIGRNGAGKSTLLKILSQVTGPTTGSIKVKGRIASLLEVGTGFHPELSGRENIFLNGAILGMRKKEIERKFDEIVDFSGVERYIDTPVKRYSSGMYVRLAFAVAAHLESEILIVDEVLAVGDAEFQKKCLGKMGDVSKGEGRTVLFVSHNLQAIASFCERGIILVNGKVHSDAPIDQSIQDYYSIIKQAGFDKNASLKDRLNRTSGKMQFSKAVPVNADGSENKMWSFKADEQITFKFDCDANEDCDGLTLYVAVMGMMNQSIITNIRYNITERKIKSGERVSFRLSIPKESIRPGQYDLYFAIGNTDTSLWYDVIDGNVNLPILNIIPYSGETHRNSGFFDVPYKIEMNEAGA